MKTKEELNALKKEVEAVGEKLRELTDEELKQVVGGGTGSEWSQDISLAELRDIRFEIGYKLGHGTY